MKNKYIKNVYIENDKIHIKSDKELSKLVLFSPKVLLKVNYFENAIDLQEIIKNNWCFFGEKSQFILCNDDEETTSLRLNQMKTMGENYLCKGFNLKIGKQMYMVDIFVNGENEIELIIEKYKDESSSYFEIGTSYIRDNFLHIKGQLKDYEELEASHNKSCGTEDMKAKLMIYDRNQETIEVNPSEAQGETLWFKINIDQVPRSVEGNVNTLLIIEDRVLDVKFKEEVRFQKIKYEDEQGMKNLIVKSEEKTKSLVFHINGKLAIAPIIKRMSYEDGNIIINGNLNATIDVFQVPGVETVIKLSAADNSIIIANSLDVVQGSFSYVISSEEIGDIKRAFSGEWNLKIEMLEDNEVLVSEDISYKNSEDDIILSEMIRGGRDNILLKAYLTEVEKKLALSVESEINIDQILSIYVGKNKLKIKYRTKENVDKLLNSRLIKTNVATASRELTCNKVVKKGKKTYVCHYKCDNVKAFVDEMLLKGVTLYTQVDTQEFKNVVSEINRYSIFFSKYDIVQSSRKYKSICLKLYNDIFLKCPVKKKRVLFESFLGRNVSGNPKYVYNYFVEQGLDKKYELIWILNNTEDEVIGRAKKVKRKTLKYYYYMATAGYWVFNARQADEIIKRPEVSYLQTWHGTPYKTLGNDMFNASMPGVRDVNDYKEKFYRNSRRWDYLIAQNDYSAEIFKRAFSFDKVMLPYGYPANDVLYKGNNEKYINQLKDKFNLPKDKKVVMYAPTWREDNFYRKGHYKMTMELELDKMMKALGDEYILILRMHYLIANTINVSDYAGFVYDLSQGCDIQELYLVSDVMITDYSSTMFDYANLRRPMVFFAYDLDKYTNDLRGAYFSLPEVAPGPVVKTTEAVIESLENISKVKEEYREKEEAFYNKFCHLDDGYAAKRVYETVFK